MTDIFKWALSLTGHIGLWCLLFNLLHATAFSRPGRKLSEKVVLLMVFAPVLWVAFQWIRFQDLSFERFRDINLVAYYYGWMCLLLGVFLIGRWGWRRLTQRLPGHVIARSTETTDVAADNQLPLLYGRYAKLLGMIPGNQATLLAIERMTFQHPALPRELDGTKITHLSDLHFTGQIAPEFFEEVVRHSNAFEPDLVFITGDIVDSAECLPWIDAILGRLQARLGKFYILGNHDLRIRDEAGIRKLMADINFTPLQDRWQSVAIGSAQLWLAGNELPWFPGADRLPPRIPEHERVDQVFKILLSHSPDQYGWAKQYGFDLMLAGHTHGGQIRFPLIGPVIAPSRYGIKYCSGTFLFDDLLMHVSRGISGDDPIRINCPPELGLLTLRATQSDE